MKFVFLILALFFNGSIFCQEKLSQKVYSYFDKAQTPNGEKRNHFVYVEMKGDSLPVWQHAIINGEVYSVHPAIMENIPCPVGERFSDKKLISLTPAPDHKLYKLDFDLVDDMKAPTDIKDTAAVVLTTSINNRKLSYRINKEIELRPLIKSE